MNYYKAVLTDDEIGIDVVSLVDYPAVESNFMLFNKQIKFSVDQNHIIGVLLRADFPIYRNGEDGEYYIEFDKPTIQEIARRYASAPHVASLQHDGNDVDGVVLEQIFIKDSQKGLNPAGFDDISDGSLFAVFKVENQAVLDKIKNGDVKGFSIEGWFSRQLKMRHSQLHAQKITKIMNFRNALKQLLLNTDIAVEIDGKMLYPEGDDWTVGTKVAYLDTDDAVADGEYKINDSLTIKVVNQEISEIVTTEEPKPEEMEEIQPETSNDLDLVAKIAELEQRLAAVEAKVLVPEQTEPVDVNKEIMSKNWHDKLKDLR